MGNQILFNDLNIAAHESFSDGDVIFEEGSSGDWIYAVIKGKVEIYKQFGGKRIVIDMLKVGDIIGEISFIDKKERSASARAVGEVELGIYDSDFLTQEYNRLPGDFKTFFDYLARRLRKMTAVATNLVGRKTDRADKTIEVEFKTKAEFKQAYSTNIGGGGLFIKTDDILPEKTTINLRFKLPGDKSPIITKAEVVWIKEAPKEGLGVEFKNLSDKDDRKLNEFIRNTLHLEP